MVQQLALFRPHEVAVATCSCEHRTVSKDGRVICSKIAQGDNSLSPATCQACPARAINCSHLRFSLRLRAPSKIIVRCNGRSQTLGEDEPTVSFQHAACAERIMPIHSTRSCSACPFRAPARLPGQVVSGQSPACRMGKVVPFAVGEPAAVA